ncbi:unannotated protein [freshwater metagenome]|uniref:Unannotated protein n=1 Tax=freshwater metagenome TaxID=449393 RepID=A0A6J7K3Y0_9ZZZZ
MHQLGIKPELVDLLHHGNRVRAITREQGLARAHGDTPAREGWCQRGVDGRRKQPGLSIAIEDTTVLGDDVVDMVVDVRPIGPQFGEHTPGDKENATAAHPCSRQRIEHVLRGALAVEGQRAVEVDGQGPKDAGHSTTPTESTRTGGPRQTDPITTSPAVADRPRSPPCDGIGARTVESRRSTGTSTTSGQSPRTGITTSLRRLNHGVQGGSKRAKRGAPVTSNPAASAAASNLAAWPSNADLDQRPE